MSKSIISEEEYKALKAQDIDILPQSEKTKIMRYEAAQKSVDSTPAKSKIAPPPPEMRVKLSDTHDLEFKIVAGKLKYAIRKGTETTVSPKEVTANSNGALFSQLEAAFKTKEKSTIETFVEENKEAILAIVPELFPEAKQYLGTAKSLESNTQDGSTASNTNIQQLLDDAGKAATKEEALLIKKRIIQERANAQKVTNVADVAIGNLDKVIYGLTGEQFKQKVMDIAGYEKFKTRKIESLEDKIKIGEIGLLYQENTGKFKVKIHDLNGEKILGGDLDYNKYINEFKAKLTEFTDDKVERDEQQKIIDLQEKINANKLLVLSQKSALLEAKREFYKHPENVEKKELVETQINKAKDIQSNINNDSKLLDTANQDATKRKLDINLLKERITKLQENAAQTPDPSVILDIMQKENIIKNSVGSPMFIDGDKIPDTSDPNQIFWGVDGGTPNPYFIQVGRDSETRRRINIKESTGPTLVRLTMEAQSSDKNTKSNIERDEELFRLLDDTGALPREELFRLSDTLRQNTNFTQQSSQSNADKGGHKPLKIESPSSDFKKEDAFTKIQDAFQPVKIALPQDSKNIPVHKKLTELGQEISVIYGSLKEGIAEFSKISSLEGKEGKQAFLTRDNSADVDIAKIRMAELKIQDFLEKNNLVNINRDLKVLSMPSNATKYTPEEIIDTYYREVNGKNQELMDKFGTLFKATQAVTKFKTLEAVTEAIYDHNITVDQVLNRISTNKTIERSRSNTTVSQTAATSKKPITPPTPPTRDRTNSVLDRLPQASNSAPQTPSRIVGSLSERKLSVAEAIPAISEAEEQARKLAAEQQKLAAQLKENERKTAEYERKKKDADLEKAALLQKARELEERKAKFASNSSEPREITKTDIVSAAKETKQNTSTVLPVGSQSHGSGKQVSAGTLPARR